MGTTIHAHIEVKKDNKWLHFAAPAVPRSYLLFAVMNGTRREDVCDEEIKNKIKPLSKINTLPDDVSTITKLCHTEDGKRFRIKNIGVLDSDDIQALQQQLWELTNTQADTMQWDLEESIFHTYINSGSIAAHAGFDDVRIVFWFDN